MGFDEGICVDCGDKVPSNRWLCCDDCGEPVCDDCSVMQDDGTYFCTECDRG